MDKIFGRPRNDDDHRVSPTDLLGLPTDQLKVMRVMLRYHELTYAALTDGFAQLPESERLDQTALDKALKVLSETNWLVRKDDGKHVSYHLGTIDRTFALNEKIQKEMPRAAHNLPPPESMEQTKPSRKRAGMDRLNSFWDKVAPGNEPKKEEKAASKGPRGSLFEELSGAKTIQPSEPPKEVKSGEWISSLFDELAVKPRAKAAKESAEDESPSGQR